MLHVSTTLHPHPLAISVARAQASSRRGRRSTPSQPAQSLPCSGLVGCSLCCARARHAEVVRSGRRQRRCVSSVLGHRAGRGDRIGIVWARARVVRGGAFPCPPRPSHGTLVRARPCARVRSMWPALSEGEQSEGVTKGCEPVARQRRAARPIGEQVWSSESRTVGSVLRHPKSRTVHVCNRKNNEL